MDHHEATRTRAVERYLLGEMTAQERGDFEQHYFGCPDCAADLRITTEFLDAARRELKRDLEAGDLTGGTGPPQGRKSFSMLYWRGALAGCAIALLGVVGYQNAVVYPRLKGEIAQLNRPSILSPLFLVGGNTRGGNTPTVALSKAQPVLMSVDIPTGEQYSKYACDLVGPSGTIIWSLPVTADQAKDTVPIVVPADGLSHGDYTLIVRGYAKEAGNAPADLAQYRFAVNSSN
jgi:hypothetical protein